MQSARPQTRIFFSGGTGVYLIAQSATKSWALLHVTNAMWQTTMFHIVSSCPQTILADGLQWLYLADDTHTAILRPFDTLHLLGFNGTGEDNSGNCSDNLAGRHPRCAISALAYIKPPPPFLCRMPFLAQPSQFSPAWDRHRIYWLTSRFPKA